MSDPVLSILGSFGVWGAINREIGAESVCWSQMFWVNFKTGNKASNTTNIT